MKQLALLTLLAAIAFAISPFISTGFNGFEPNQFPVPQDNPPVQPAGYAFSIWLVIYVWLIAGSVFGLLRRPAAPGWHAMRPALLLSLGAGVFWLPLAQISVPWATLLIFFMLATAITALLRAGPDDPPWLREPVGLYAGWLTAASSVSVGLMLAGYDVLDATLSALIALALALTIAGAVITLRRDSLAYPAGVVWALVGVIAANISQSNLPVIALAALGALAVSALAWRARKQA